jgi:hypothetical protein
MTRKANPIEEKAAAWSEAFLAEARFSGAQIDRLDQRILSVQKLWACPVDRTWGRGEKDDARWKVNGQQRRYRRSHSELGAQRDEEHALEKAILEHHFNDITCFGGRLVDGINAVPLCAFKMGKVEADLLLLVREPNGRSHRIFLVEAKTNSNNPWYAVVEHLRQLKLLEVSAVKRIFHRRNPSLSLPEEIPVTGLILAPGTYYSSPGQKGNAVEPARRLIADLGIDLKLAIWDKARLEISGLGETSAKACPG